MSAILVLIDLEIFRDSFSHVLSGSEVLAVNRFNLARMKEAFSARIVIVAARTTHATQQAMPVK